MDFKNLVEAIVKTAQCLGDAWLVKTIIAILVGSIASVHGSALLWFVTLVFIDLFTRWIALGYAHLKDCSKESDLLSCILDIPAAFRAGYINSDAMKHRFAGKIILYLFLTIMAVSADNMLNLVGEEKLLLKVVWTYLASTEAMSVLENLRDAGIEQAGSLLDFFRSRMSVLFDRFKQK